MNVDAMHESPRSQMDLHVFPLVIRPVINWTVLLILPFLLLDIDNAAAVEADRQA